MRFGSVCSGIEAASVAWHPLGWKAAWLSEIEPFPCAVLAHHYPDVPNYGDMTKLPDRILASEIEAPDVFCGGTPCQAFSVAGLRKSLDDERGNLSLTFCEIADAIDTVRRKQKQQPCIVFWENVPGVLNTADNAFGCFLAGLAGEDEALIAPGGRWQNAGFVDGPERAVAWRVLDAQYFGVAQRRRRVFVVASARADFDPAAVLFEFDGLRRDTAPSREAGQKPAPTVVSGPPFSRTGNERVECDAIVPAVANCLETTCNDYSRADGFNMIGQPIPLNTQVITRHNALGRGTGFGMGDEGEPAYTISAAHSHAVAQPIECLNPNQPQVWRVYGTDGMAPTLQSGEARGNAILNKMAVRRLTPVECERLQGFPDNYTAIPWRNKAETPDGPRYKALGNSWAVPVVRWIGERIVRALA